METPLLHISFICCVLTCILLMPNAQTHKLGPCEVLDLFLFQFPSLQGTLQDRSFLDFSSEMGKSRNFGYLV